MSKSVASVLASYDSSAPRETALQLRELWLQADKAAMASIEQEQGELQEIAGLGVPALKELGDAVAREAGKKGGQYLPLARALWQEFGPEGRIVAAVLMGTLGQARPNEVLPVLHEMAEACVGWQDVDRLAMDALEPVVRQKPQAWLSTLEPWLVDKNKWVRRAGITVIGRLPMKYPELTRRTLDLAERLLRDEDPDVRRAVSFAIRMSARGEIPAVVGFLARHVPPTEPSGNWVLCDVICSMSKQSLPSFAGMLTRYERWAKDPKLSAQDKSSVDSAVQVLREAARKRGRA